ncbi:MAG TPA: AAA family ATPase [Candidatus Paceibacterota bacterium]|nr:AAA family ATPase [Verrucomicrobiota bacterium]HSA11365.1 AAA family ATPase [Candidatus Paceibacterota bacterium]
MKSAAASPAPASAAARLPLTGWALELARRWNGGTYSLFILHGNIFDLFPVQDHGNVRYESLKTFLVSRLFPERGCLLFYNISNGLSFGSAEMQKRFFKWLADYDSVENTAFHASGPPRDFLHLAPLLRRFFLRVAEEKEKWRGITLVIDFPEKLIPACEEANASMEERMNLVTFLEWAASQELARLDIGVVLVSESAAELHADLLQSPHVCQVRIDLPDAEERLRFLKSGWAEHLAGGKPTSDWSDFTSEELAARTSGLNLLRIRHFLAAAIRNGIRVTQEHVTASKKRLIEEYCQGLVRFKDPKPGVSLDRVATHAAAKQRLRELAWLIKNGKTDVLERGVLVPGRVGVGKSFLIDCFASECALPVMEMGEFRSKWVGDTERQQARILMTIRALGPVIVVVDEADAVFGTREADGDSGVSGRVFAAFAAHIGDSSLRGRELWVAMTSRPDLLAIDMKRQGRFGLCIPLFPAQGPEDVLELFATVARVKGIALAQPSLTYIRQNLGARPLTGSDVESILIRAKERAVLAKRDDDVQRRDLEEAVSSFIDPLDPELLKLQELAAVLACSDKRYLPEQYLKGDRAAHLEDFARLKLRAGRR